jgi:protein-disulfide isomerase
MLIARRTYAEDVLKVGGTPTFFVNGDMIVGEAAFEEFDKRIKTLLKNRFVHRIHSGP